MILFKRFTVFVFILFSSIAFSVSSEEELKLSRNDDFLSVVSNNYPHKKILERLSNQYGFDLHIIGSLPLEGFTINNKRISLEKLIKRIVGHRYVLSYKKNRRISKLFVLEFGNDEYAVNDGDLVNDYFSGNVMFNKSKITMLQQPSSLSKEDLISYKLMREAQFNDLMKSHPDEEINSQISFSEGVDQEKFISMFEGKDVDVKSVQSSFNDHTSMYEFDSSLSLEDNFDNYKTNELEFIEVIKKQDDNNTIHHLEDHVLSNGFSIDGAVVIGQVNSIAMLRKEDKTYLVDPLWNGDRSLNNTTILSKPFVINDTNEES